IPLVILGLLLSITLTKPLNALLLGEQYAQSMGLHIGRSRFWIIVSTSILAGCITAFCGPIAFVGIAVPHIARLMFNTSDHRVLVPAVSLTGALLMLFCRSEEHTSELQSRENLVCRLLLEKKK